MMPPAAPDAGHEATGFGACPVGFCFCFSQSFPDMALFFPLRCGIFEECDFGFLDSMGIIEIWGVLKDKPNTFCSRRQTGDLRNQEWNVMV